MKFSLGWKQNEDKKEDWTLKKTLMQVIAFEHESAWFKSVFVRF